MADAERFPGRVALVTGGASGIGAAVARRLLDEGARVASLDLAANAPDGVLGLTGDVSRPADVEDARARGELGAIDVGLEGSRERDDEVDREGRRRHRGARQLRGSGGDRDADPRRHLAGPHLVHGRAHPHAADGRAARGRGPRLLARERGVLVLHRCDLRRLRRPGRLLAIQVLVRWVPLG